MTIRTLSLLTLLALTLAGPIQAQERPTAWTSSEPPTWATSVEPLDPPAAPVPSKGAGVLAGTLGLVAGGAAGYFLEDALLCGPYDEYCGLAGAAVGAALGESLLLPLGVHLSGGRQGNYAWSALASVGIGSAGLLLAVPTRGLSLLAVPLWQLESAVRIERATSRPQGTEAAVTP